MRELTQQEKAAMWLYHNEYAAAFKLDAIEFYQRLSQPQKDTVDQMIAEILRDEANSLLECAECHEITVMNHTTTCSKAAQETP